MRLRRLFTRHRGSAPRGDVAPVVELDRWQLTGLLMGVLVIAVGAFFVGRMTSRNAPAPAPPSLTAQLQKALPATASARERQIALAEIWPPTSGIDEGLSRPIPQPLPSDPTERARAQAHLQLQEARSLGLRDDAAPLPSAPIIPTVTPHAAPADPGGGAAGVSAGGHARGGGFTLQISLFDSAAAAQVIAGQLESTGATVRVRQVMGPDQRTLFRVEVGDFSTSEAALAFQRRFERDTGYSGVLITL